ncbi:MAG: RNA polymerase factor sigma-54 [Alphaproteobacteria bacterium]|nr:RNA polymerase factor sigma-54 [Alphaproteobacteria bacterium]
MSQGLHIGQSQTLTMTPQLQQAIKLLQLSNIELAEYVESEIEKNPLLEKDERDQGQDTADGGADGREDQGSEEAKARDEIAEAFDSGNFSDGSDFDPGASMASIGSGGSLKFEDPEESFENRMEAPKTLREHLSDQLHMACEDPRDRMIGALLIDRIDEAGYMRDDHTDLADRLGCSLERVERLLSVLKGFDPTGVFAANLPECLALQLEERGQLDAPMKRLLEHLELLGNRDFTALSDICGVNETYLSDMIAEIKALNPKPAADFDHLVVQTAIPDILMKRLPKTLGGGWRVELNHETLPKVLINQDYYTQVAGSAVQKKDKDYLTSQINSANWLIKALDQRAQTILKTAASIVEQQDAFFNYGIEFLKPLTLKDIAEEIGMHESTVSRVTTNKYIGTPRGIFELKYFFSTALVSADGTAHSAESVKARIKSLIDAEDPKKILSDDRIVSILKDEGIDLARRTVAKYRESLHIGSSVQRRKAKKNLA